jgi:hypothetical protein
VAVGICERSGGAIESRDGGYARCARGRTSGDWRCTGDAGRGMGGARKARFCHDVHAGKAHSWPWQALINLAGKRGLGEVVRAESTRAIDTGAN